MCELFAEIDALHRRHLPHMFRKSDGAACGRGVFLAWIDDDDVLLLVGELGEELVGFAQAVLREAPASPIFVPRRYAVVDSLFVQPGCQRRGIGRALMDSVQDWASAQGATAIELNVYEFNQTALSFYESLGYQTLSRKMSKELRKDTASSFLHRP